MKRHRVIQGRGASFSRSRALDCRNEADPFSLEDIVDIPTDRLYQDSTGECYDKAQLQQHILHSLDRGVRPTWPSGALVRQEISEEVFRDLDIIRLIADSVRQKMETERHERIRQQIATDREELEQFLQEND